MNERSLYQNQTIDLNIYKIKWTIYIFTSYRITERKSESVCPQTCPQQTSNLLPVKHNVRGEGQTPALLKEELCSMQVNELQHNI